jgi:RNA polymerase-binding transcription factor DksA
MARSSSSAGSQHAAIDDAAIRDLREQLVAERAVQRGLVVAHDQTARTLTGQRDVDSLLEREVAEDLAARAREAIADIDDAIARMDGGTYGRCDTCGAPIPLERLEVMPYARLCVPCSRERATRR